MSTAAPAYHGWEIEKASPEEWKKSSVPLEEDTRLEEALKEATGIVTDQFDEDEPTILSAAFGRAKEFLETQSFEIKKRFGYFPPAPSILPGPNGSVDLRWNQPGWGLLINFPADGNHATFYGDCVEGGRIKGTLDQKVWDLRIATWLTKQ
jgi:hypothetical protein